MRIIHDIPDSEAIPVFIWASIPVLFTVTAHVFPFCYKVFHDCIFTANGG